MKDVDEVVRLAKQGCSRMEVQRRLGVSMYWLKQLEGVPWPKRGRSRGCRARIRANKRPEAREWLRQQAIDAGRAPTYDVGDGRWLTAGQIAQEIGGTIQGVKDRIKAGRKGADLLKKADSRRGARPRKHVYETGLSTDEWQIVLEHARRVNVRAAALMYGVPIGAIRAMLNGEDWRVE